jgi:NADH-quinone oxidoreductase subunit J
MTFTPSTIAFFAMALFTLVGGFGVVSSRNLIHAAIFLVLSLFGIAGLYILLEAPFLAAVQVLVYLGAIAVLITITVMVTRRITGKDVEAVNRQWPWAALIAALVLVTLGFVILTQFGGITSAADVPADNITELGMAFGNSQAFSLPFEVASVLLLAALIGSIVVARD